MPDEPRTDVVHEVARVTDQAGLGLLCFDRRPRVAYANRTAHRLLDRRPGSLVGRTPMEALLDHRLERLVQAAIGGAAGTRTHASGDRPTLVVRARPADGPGAWVTLQDVTELERLRRIRSEFVENLSHELRTPLANVRLLTEMLMDDLARIEAPERLRERAATIDVETGHLVQMFDELLDLSRMEQAATPIHHDEFDLAALVTETLRRLRTFAERQGVVLSMDVPSDLPAVRGDAERLGQLLMNLLHNAIKFSPEGGQVTVTVHRQAAGVVVSVADEGVGIPTADQSRVFERFYKVDRARHRGLGGTGLGLAIARHIAEAHGGRIWLESVEGRGSTFSVMLPSS